MMPIPHPGCYQEKREMLTHEAAWGLELFVDDDGTASICTSWEGWLPVTPDIADSIIEMLERAKTEMASRL